MAFLWDFATSFYNDTMKMTDRRSDGWFMTDGPWPTLFIIAFYVYFCTVLGPKLMKGREPMKFRRIMIIYNFGLVALSGYLLLAMIWYAWQTSLNIVYEPNDLSRDPLTLYIIGNVYVGYVMKLIEMMDTVFFVLRKKTKQISLLHLYHHGSMPLNVWIMLRFMPGGRQAIVGASINCFIHVIMYSYYTLAAMGPKFQKYLWFKRYLTQLQIAQFVIGLIHIGQLLFIEHNYPKGIMKYGVVNGVIFLTMFVNFYVNEYRSKKAHAEDGAVKRSSKKMD